MNENCNAHEYFEKNILQAVFMIRFISKYFGKDNAMINCKLLSCLIIIVLLFPLTIQAEFYKYVDAKGVSRFTDNLADIPENQREEIDHYKEAVSIPKAPASETEIGQAEIPSGKEPENIKKTQTKLSDQQIKQIKLFGNKILELQKLLNNEYQKLVADKKAIELKDQVSGPKKSDVIQQLKKQAEELNKRIEAYNRIKARYRDEIAKYNQKIKNVSAEKK